MKTVKLDAALARMDAVSKQHTEARLKAATSHATNPGIYPGRKATVEDIISTLRAMLPPGEERDAAIELAKKRGAPK